MRTNGSGQGLLNQILAELPQKHLGTYWSNIVLIQNTVSEASGKMEEFMCEPRGENQEDEAQEIRSFLEEIVPLLRQVPSLLEEIIRCFDALCEELALDWARDLEEVIVVVNDLPTKNGRKDCQR
jgi:hypothetical protein